MTYAAAMTVDEIHISSENTNAGSCEYVAHHLLQIDSILHHAYGPTQ